ncbi:MAG: hypothetical protein PVI88_00060 [Nitrosopumilaceae archaeon]|jgi:hypothetical protein
MKIISGLQYLVTKVVSVFKIIKRLYNKDKLNLSKTITIPFTNRNVTVVFGWLVRDKWALFSVSMFQVEWDCCLSVFELKVLKFRIHIITYKRKGTSK